MKYSLLDQGRRVPWSQLIVALTKLPEPSRRTAVRFLLGICGLNETSPDFSTPMGRVTMTFLALTVRLVEPVL